jgi:hypothetical protein
VLAAGAVDLLLNQLSFQAGRSQCACPP